MEQIELKDLQGLIVRGYAELQSAAFMVLKVTDAPVFKKWLQQHINEVTPGNVKPTDTAMNIAFTFAGLRALGLNKDSLDSFPLEFEDGMTTRQKQALLGDFGNSDPANWQWGQKGNDDTHVLLALYAANMPMLESLCATVKQQLVGHCAAEVKMLDTSNLVKRKEHFGFHDGIAQPTIDGLSRKDSPENTVAAGEFILGYKNEYGQYDYSPVVPGAADKNNVLPASDQVSGMKDLGKNGTYLVFRQLEQDVHSFWNYMDKKTKNEDGSCNPEQMVKLASKMVGRWPSGAPLALSPDKDSETMADMDKFGYRQGDGDGLKCPFASHVRRTNPRDSIDTDKKTSIKIANKHRIVRRGRSYGSPVEESMDPMDIIKSDNKEGTRGLHFICFNTNLTLQFEFIQNFWVNNPKFGGLYDERDPVMGNHSHPLDSRQSGTFSVENHPIRKRHTDVPEFVTVKGGAYFFLPGIRALTFLASI
ncbi:MAG: peroxidase [Flavipsychrobacter sp.]|nr:peroxidase [Flavipsychrobacter sp.]